MFGFPINSFLEGFLLAQDNTFARLRNCGIKVDISKWTCSYCNSINTIESNCKNCAAPEIKGLRNFEGLPFKKSTFLYRKEDN